MIRQRFTLGRNDWEVFAYYAVDAYYVDEIMSRLIEIGCRGKDLKKAYKNLDTGDLDTGLTYSNYGRRQSVMVIALTSSPKEFEKSWRHESGHLAAQICETFGIPLNGEEIQYLGQDIVDATWDIAKHFLCKCGKRKVKHLIDRR
ncbi:MAG: hypothetical protein NC410_09035 [Oscillibacter sp.]|nr:hypothetical protein [Oscillibacter sp.]